MVKSCNFGILDLQKTFDKVDHNILMSKLHHYGSHFFTNRKQYDSIDGGFSFRSLLISIIQSFWKNVSLLIDVLVGKTPKLSLKGIFFSRNPVHTCIMLLGTRLCIILLMILLYVKLQ